MAQVARLWRAATWGVGLKFATIRQIERVFFSWRPVPLRGQGEPLVRTATAGSLSLQSQGKYKTMAKTMSLQSARDVEMLELDGNVSAARPLYGRRGTPAKFGGYSVTTLQLKVSSQCCSAET